MTASPLTCLAVGHLTHDRYEDTIAAGGSVLYAARAVQALGGCAAVATAFGDDYAFRGELAGVELFVSASRHTTLFENTYPEGRARLMLVEHPAEVVTPGAVPVAWRSPDVLFLAPVVGEVSLAPWLDADLCPRIVGLGLQGFLKKQGPPYLGGAGCSLRPRPFEPSPEALEKVTAVFLSQEDLTGYADSALLERLVRHVPVVAVTDGENGAVLHFDGRQARVGVRRVTALDPTGAGDTFAAGTLFALAEGAGPVEAARLGAAAASLVVAKQGPAGLSDVALARQYVGDISVSRGTGQGSAPPKKR